MGVRKSGHVMRWPASHASSRHACGSANKGVLPALPYSADKRDHQRTGIVVGFQAGVSR